jgi:hypothetical protein
VKGAVLEGGFGSDAKTSLAQYFTFNGPNKAQFEAATTAIIVDAADSPTKMSRVDMVFATGKLPGDSPANIVIAEAGKFASDNSAAATLEVFPPGEAAVTNIPLGSQAQNNDSIVIEMTTPGSATFASQRVLDRYWADSTGKIQLFTISPMDGIKGYDPAMARNGATITRTSSTKITISGLAPLQEGSATQKITLNPIVFADASVPVTVTAASALASGGAVPILAPGSQGALNVTTPTTVDLSPSGTYFMKSGSTWYTIAATGAATSRASLEDAFAVTAAATTKVINLLPGVEYDIYRVLTPVRTGTAAVQLASRTLKVGAADSANAHFGIMANTIVCLSKLQSTDKLFVTSTGNVSNAVQLLFYTGNITAGTPWFMPTQSDSKNTWLTGNTLSNNITSGRYYRMGSENWLYKMEVSHQGAPGAGPALVLNKADDFTTLRGMNAVGYSLNLTITRGLILEEASRGKVEMGANGVSTDGKITITGLDATLDGSAKGYVVREMSSSGTASWHTITTGEVANGSSSPATTAFDYGTATAQNRKASGNSNSNGTLTGDSGGDWAPTPTWAVFYLQDNDSSVGSTDPDVTLDGKDTAINFLKLKYETDAAVAKTGGLYGVTLKMNTPPKADFDVAVNLGSGNVTNTSDTSSTSLANGEFKDPGGTFAVVFNDTEGSLPVDHVKYEALANATYFTMTMKAGLSSAFTTKIVPAPETLAILPKASSGTALSINYNLTLTAATPGEFINITKTEFNTNDNIKYPTWVVASSTGGFTQVPSVNGVMRGTDTAAERGKLYGYMAGASLTALSDAAGDSNDWSIVKDILKRKTTKVTGAYTVP